jgi:hypothetical protein
LFRFLFVSLFLIVCLTSSSNAFAKKVEEDVGAWGIVNLEIPVTEKLSITTEPQLRWTEKGTHAGQQQWRNALNYDITENTTLTVGHMWTARHRNNEDLFTDTTSYENRLYQQVAYKHTVLKKLKVDHRFRLEERLLTDIEDPLWYARYRLRVRVPIKKKSTPAETVKTHAVVSSELLAHINRVETVKAGLVQQRHFVGINHAFNRHLNVDAGYQLVLGDRFEQGRSFVNHTVLVQFNIVTPPIKMWVKK